MTHSTWPSLKFTTRTVAVFCVVVFCFFALLFIAHPVLAQTALEQFGDTTKLSQTNLIVIIARLIRAFLGILGIIFVVLIIYAGWLYMSSGGDPAKTKKAKDLIKNAVIGFVIIMSSYGIASFVINAILKATGAQGVSQSSADTYSEPLASALGAGIIDSHYPIRGAKEIPRNTKIFITFKEAINPADLIKGYDPKLTEMDEKQSKQLNDVNVWIFETEDKPSSVAEKPKKMLGASEVNVATNKAHTVFVFDPVGLLGSSTGDTNYSVTLLPAIKKADKKTNAFSGVDSKGYGWTFEVSTEVDLTPPKVIQETPKNNTTVQKNATVELTFNEAMDPVSGTGSYLLDQPPLFANVSIVYKDGDQQKNVEGTFEISNGYKTIGFTSNDPCGKDPCGDTIYCLPGSQKLDVKARAASIDKANPPQAQLNGVSYDGLTDAAGNSLDGSGDGAACGSSTDGVVCTDQAASDDYQWSFTTTGEMDTTVPQIISLNPDIGEQEIDQNAPLQMSFNVSLKSTTINSTHVSVWPDPLYKDKNLNKVPMWFYAHQGATSSTIELEHQAFVSNAQGGWDYYPVVTHGLKSNYQICMYPAMQEGGACNGGDATKPYCCSGVPSSDACTTDEDKGKLPGNQ